MKKRNLLLVVLFLSMVNMFAQEYDPQINLGANAGISTKHTQVVVGLDGELLFNVDANFKVGAATGLIFATENNGVILPLALAGRFKADTKFNLGLDLGFALPINNSSSSFYVRPMLEYQFSYRSRLKFSYSGLNSNGYLNLGIMFRFNHNRRTLSINY